MFDSPCWYVVGSCVVQPLISTLIGQNTRKVSDEESSCDTCSKLMRDNNSSSRNYCFVKVVRGERWKKLIVCHVWLFTYFILILLFIVGHELWKMKCPFCICVEQLGMCGYSFPVTRREENSSTPTALYSTPLTPKVMVSAEVRGNLAETFVIPKMFMDSQWFHCCKEKCQIVYKVLQPWFRDSTLSWFFTEWLRTSTGRPRHLTWTCKTGEQSWFGRKHEVTIGCNFEGLEGGRGTRTDTRE